MKIIYSFLRSIHANLFLKICFSFSLLWGIGGCGSNTITLKDSSRSLTQRSLKLKKTNPNEVNPLSPKLQIVHGVFKQKKFDQLPAILSPLSTNLYERALNHPQFKADRKELKAWYTFLKIIQPLHTLSSYSLVANHLQKELPPLLHQLPHLTHIHHTKLTQAIEAHRLK